MVVRECTDLKRRWIKCKFEKNPKRKSEVEIKKKKKKKKMVRDFVCRRWKLKLNVNTQSQQTDKDSPHHQYQKMESVPNQPEISNCESISVALHV